MGYRVSDPEKADSAYKLEKTTGYMVLSIRIIGLLLLLVGLWIALRVISEAWGLYQAPHHVERFAVAVESGSNVDKVLAVKAKGFAGKGGLSDDDGLFRLSYFAAWGLVFLLLLLIGRLAMAAIKTGGELALYDIEVKKFATMLLDQVKRDPERTPEPIAEPASPKPTEDRKATQNPSRRKSRR